MKFGIKIFITLVILPSLSLDAQFKNKTISFEKYSSATIYAGNLRRIVKENTVINSSYFNKFLNTATPSVTSSSQTDLTLFSNIGNNIADSFKGDNLYLHLAGVASTVLIVTTNTDYEINKFFYEHQELGNVASPITRIGFYLPFVVGGSLYAYGKLKSDDEVLGASFAVIQSSLLTLAYNSLLKAITGRPHPDPANEKDMKGLSKTFRFGFLRGGVFWGWPSGHTSSTMSVVSSLTNYYPDKSWLKIAGYSLVAYMIYGVTSVHGGRMHWFSDAIAAAFMSYAIGSTVGKYYRNKLKQSGSPSPAATSPLGVSFSFQF